MVAKTFTLVIKRFAVAFYVVYRQIQSNIFAFAEVFISPLFGSE